MDLNTILNPCTNNDPDLERHETRQDAMLIVNPLTVPGHKCESHQNPTRLSIESRSGESLMRNRNAVPRFSADCYDYHNMPQPPPHDDETDQWDVSDSCEQTRTQPEYPPTSNMFIYGQSMMQHSTVNAEIGYPPTYEEVRLQPVEVEKHDPFYYYLQDSLQRMNDYRPHVPGEFDYEKAALIYHSAREYSKEAKVAWELAQEQRREHELRMVKKARAAAEKRAERKAQRLKKAQAAAESAAKKRQARAEKKVRERERLEQLAIQVTAEKERESERLEQLGTKAAADRLLAIAASEYAEIMEKRGGKMA